MWCQAVKGLAGRGSSKLSYGREVSQEMMTKERLFRKVCKFVQEFLILAIDEQAIYLIELAESC